MVRAIWSDVVLAETDRPVMLEGSVYFPPESLRREYFTKSRTVSLCLWKGIARYYSVTVGDRTARSVAWYYPHPSPLARKIKNHVAFRGDVRVER